MPLNIDMIRSSFELVKPMAVEVSEYFYQTLFRSFPEVKPLFEKTNLINQKNALIQSLVFIVDHLDQPEKLNAYLKKMGARHLDYGVTENNYEAVGKSLIMSFRYFFGAKWTRELEDQWIHAYGVIAETMIHGAREAAVAKTSVRTQETVASGPVPAATPAAVVEETSLHDELNRLARSVAQKLIFRALEQDLDQEFYVAARKRAQGILMQAIREEAEAMQQQFPARKSA